MVFLWLGMQHAPAQSIENATTTSPGILPTYSGNSVNATILPDTSVPAFVNVATYSGQNATYDLNVGIATGNFTYTQSGLTGPFNVFNFQNESGRVIVANESAVTWNNALALNNGLGSAAIQAIGLPRGGTTDTDLLKSGSDVTVASSGNLTLYGAGIENFGPDIFAVNGFRTADLSGILAVSYGNQTLFDTTHAGGNVTVTTSNASISLSQSDPVVITAGISASSSNGPAEFNGTYREQASPVVTVNIDNTEITNSADSGAGIVATNIGAQFNSGNTSLAIGGNVSVSLNGNSSISLTGETGIGIFAISEIYPVDDSKNTPLAQAGDVDVVIGAGSGISTGTTNSTFSAGILAVSAGSDLLLNPFGSSAVDGSGKGNAGTVTVTNNGTISSNGTFSMGVAALSIGGASITTSNNSSQSFVGNSGDTTAQGADTTVVNNGSILTNGASAYGIVALSSGGGGLVNNLIAASGNLTANQGLVIGGNGSTDGSGPGSNGGTILVTQNGSISTGNATSIGIIAQSIGGAGGNGGGNHPALFVGDKGGNGGEGGNVTVNTQPGSTLTTNGTNSLGVLMQSIGGGGGNGGNAAGIFVAVGGKGGKGGDGGTVSGNFSGTFLSAADHSTAVMAQSVGGGGGHGGSATAVGALVDTGIGGKGNTGGDGGDVTVAQALEASSITTLGNNSAGLHLQSIGGGGGAGGNSLSLDGSQILGINVAIGGGGSGGGSGGTVLANNGGTITTGVQSTANATTSVPNQNGADSAAIFAQSIGGGGGHGGGAVAKSSVWGGAEEDIPVAVSLVFTLGGQGGTGGGGGNVTVDNAGSVTTYGDGSYGLAGQSVGGGGGNAGDSTAASTLHATASQQVNLQIGLGGTAGSGGHGGTVDVIHNPDEASTVLATYGQNAHAILAQSIGGGGGTAGVGNAGADPDSGATSGEEGGESDIPNFAFTAGIGGSGGSGGNAGSSTAFNGGTINTFGSTSFGIFAQSIGGGGGLGSGGNADGDNTNITIDLTVGGSGTNGGSGNTVGVTNIGTIATKGGAAIGIAAQSIGGGGGSGGSTDTYASVPLSESISSIFDPEAGYTSTIAVGGKGGSGGAGGNVSVSNSIGSITTEGDRAYGILAQSISGGGGMGGSAASGSNSAFFGTSQQFSIDVAVGGSGGSSHSSGHVTVDNESLVGTSGYGAHAIVAQSVSGGGGIGGDGTTNVRSVLGLGFGVNKETQTGSISGTGGAVFATNNGTVTTRGADSIGTLAQSIGGGGGMAHSGNTSPLTFNGTVSIVPIVISANLGINVSGATNINGGLATVNHGSSASTTTQHDWSHGLVAQSVGAGGGKISTILAGSANGNATVANFTSSNVTLSNNTTITTPNGLQLGAADGKGNGNTVTVNLNGQITTGATGASPTGYAAYGVLAQSLGGGGGMATDNSQASTGNITLGGNSSSTSTPNTGGNGGLVSVSGNATLLTRGESAHGVILQSIGGGGGLAGSGSSADFQGNNTLSAHNIQLGGRNADGFGFTANYTSTGGSVTTHGRSAHAVIVQSIGGGGGIVTVDTGSNQTGGSVTLGASAGSNHHNFYGGEVLATLGSGTSLLTAGDTSFGLVGQSIGAGGGIANTGQSGGTVTLGANLGNVSPDEFGGGQVTVTLASGSAIATNGNGSHAIIAQSIGGGGGIANADSSGGFTTDGTPGNPRQTHGYGSSVNVSNNATIRTSGAGAFGILAQSIGGGGGLSGSFAGSTGGNSSSGHSSSSSGNNGNVVVSTTGNITASGSGSVAIFAQNVTAGSYGLGNISVSVNGTLIGGSGPGAYGVWIDGGQTNTLTIGSSGSIQAGSKSAIQYTGTRHLNVTNNGIVAGSVSLSDTSATMGVFTNTLDATFLAEGTINAVVNDSGTLVIGTSSTIGANATFLGNYTQEVTGTVVFDIIGIGNYDQMLFGGLGKAKFEDEIEINFSSIYVAQVGDTFTLIGSAASGTNFIPNSWATSSSTGNPAVGVSGLGFGVEWETTVLADQSFQISITAIPEPSTAFLIVMAGLGVVLARRFRRA